MPFRFAYVSDLLQKLDDNQQSRTGQTINSNIIGNWFDTYRSIFARNDFTAAPLLSTLLPEKRSDRVYFIQARTLARLVARTLGLGRSRIRELAQWEEPGAGLDLGDCVERILKKTPNFWQEDVTVEEIDSILHNIASNCHFSSPAVRASRSSQSRDKETAIGNLYRRVSHRDAKWLTRLILKNFEPVVLDPNTVYRGLHPLLPTILKVQEDFSIAGRFLQEHVRRKGVTGADLSRDDLALRLKPRLGVKVGRQPWLKGRSIKNCLDMSHGRMSVEDKLDGEYCQIHIDLSKGYNCIQIFSKSGKDSTQDRKKLHEAIRNSLQLGKRSCPLRTGCILEGELLVWNELEKKILGFEKIRKHVSRSGAFLGTEQDSQPHPYEHLMIIYFDVLMIDNESLLGVGHSQRRKRLEELIHCQEGQSQLVRRHLIDREKRTAASDLRRIFAQCITNRAEGLVLKADDPYFNFSTRRRPYSSSCIKLKKEYIGGFGDVGDFAVVGARYDTAKAKTYDLPNLKWTHFYVGCLDNKEEVERWSKKPRFVVTNVVELNATQMESFISHANPRYTTEAENDSITLKIEPGIDNGKRPSAIFTDPPIFDIRCFSFHKEGNTGFWSPRFAMVNKIHFDRTYVDVLSFAELQDTARMEKEMPPQSESQEIIDWIAALEQADPRNTALGRASQSTTITTVSTVGTELTPSPIQSSKTTARHQTSRPIPESPLSTMRKARSVIQAQAVAPLTPPRSSALTIPSKHIPAISDLPQPASTDIPAVSVTPQPTRKRTRDRELRDTPRQQKARKQAAGDSPASSSPLQPSSSSQPTPRAALGDITSSSQSRDNASVLPKLPNNRRINGVHSFHVPRLINFSSESNLSTASFHTAPEVCRHLVNKVIPDSQDMGIRSSSPSRLPSDMEDTPRANDQLMTPRRSTEQRIIIDLDNMEDEHYCMFSGAACPLRNISFFLAPCIAKMPWLTEDLFSKHGIQQANIITTLEDWKHLPSSGKSTPTGTAKAPRERKILLVEHRRQAVVDALFQDIEGAQLRRRNRKRDWVSVYDWRVIEALTLEEEKRGCCSGGKADGRLDIKDSTSLWQKYWIGLA